MNNKQAEKGFVELLILVIVLPLFLITYFFLVRPFQIVGNAMAPNYRDGQYYLARVAGYVNPERGNVIVFRMPTDPNKDNFKRIIGLPGEKIMIKENAVYINEEKLDESTYLKADIATFGGAFIKEGQAVTIPVDQYFVLGDNRPFSADSREWGFLPKKNIIGKMMLCYYNCSSSSK